MSKLFVKCKTCGIWFNTGLESANLHGLNDEGRVHKCPLGHEHKYSKADYKSEEFFNRPRRVAGRLTY